MPIPYTPPPDAEPIDLVLPPPSAIGIKLIEPWASNHEQDWHSEALINFGERIMLRVAWTPIDYRDGLVDRCTTCMQGSSPSIQARFAELYKQAGESHCPNCFGIGFEGGFHPETWVSYMLAADVDESLTRDRTGVHLTEAPIMQFPWTPILGDYDLLIRAESWTSETEIDVEEGRYKLESTAKQSVRTGLQYAIDPTITVAQVAQIVRLPTDHSYYQVPLSY